jgi:hypothetical protein
VHSTKIREETPSRQKYATNKSALHVCRAERDLGLLVVIGEGSSCALRQELT